MSEQQKQQIVVNKRKRVKTSKENTSVRKTKNEQVSDDNPLLSSVPLGSLGARLMQRNNEEAKIQNAQHETNATAFGMIPERDLRSFEESESRSNDSFVTKVLKRFM